MKSSCVFYADQFLRHGLEGHVESPGRLTAALRHLRASGLSDRLDLLAPRNAEDSELCAVHEPEYVQYLETRGPGWLDPDTPVTSGSAETARLAAGAAVGAVEQVSRGGRKLAFGLVRPPGHHAFPGKAMGFCLYNNAAVGAASALGDRKKVLIVDWDVHHGNGTEAIFYGNPAVLYFSVHQSPHFPHTGKAEDVGTCEGEGFNVNVPLPPGSADADFLEAFRRVLVPIADAFRPDQVIVSAGYDAAEGDPLGDMRMTPAGFQKLAFTVKDLGKARGVAALLEGGYSPLLPECISASILGFLGEDVEISPETTAAAMTNIGEAVRVQKQYWRL